MGIDLFLAVEMAKTLPVFKRLSMDDKVSNRLRGLMRKPVRLGLTSCPRRLGKHGTLAGLLLSLAAVIGDDLPWRIRSDATNAVRLPLAGLITSDL